LLESDHFFCHNIKKLFIFAADVNENTDNVRHLRLGISETFSFSILYIKALIVLYFDEELSEFVDLDEKSWNEFVKQKKKHLRFALSPGSVRFEEEKHSFKRNRLTSPPVFDLIIGNLLAVKGEIEQKLRQRFHAEHTKENFPFLCVVNLSRSGKSLLLDEIFRHENNIVVIPITYHSSTSFTSKETDCVATAIQYFWLRVFLAVSGMTLSFYDAFSEFGNQLNGFRDVCRLLKELKLPSFGLEEKNIVFCVDEFSALTDAANGRWNKREKTDFVKELQNRKCPRPFRQFVFIGFNEEMTSLLVTGASVDSFTLKHCSFKESKPLLRLIYSHYEKINWKEHFPVLIYESVKSVPGLIGQWAEFVCDQVYVSSLETFAGKVPWLKHLVEQSRIQANYLLMLKYFVYYECRIPIPEEFQSELVSSAIGVCNEPQQTVEIPPICITVLTLFMKKRSVDTTLLKNLSDALTVIESYKLHDKAGSSFKSFVKIIIKIRFEVRLYGRKLGISQPISYGVRSPSES
jgi:hypothetical protein